MPYRSIRELPKAVKDNLPTEAQKQFLRVANSVLAHGGDEESAFKQAWGVIKKRWKKVGGNWVKKKTAMSDQAFFVPFADRGDGWYLYFPFSKVFHYGREIDFTKESGEQMVKNFKADVPGYDLPINTLHRDELGVFGNIADLRVADTEVQWKPKWFDGKADEVKSKGYKYASPEVVVGDFEYQALDGTEHKNVALGVGMTPRPRLGRATAVFSEKENEWEFAELDSNYIAAIIEGVLERFAKQDFKTDRGMKFKRGAYLINSSDNPSEWKVRIEESPGKITVAQLGRAAAALGPQGFRGEKLKGVSPAQISAAKGKLVAEYRKQGVEKDDIPKYLFSEEETMSDEMVMTDTQVSSLADRIREILGRGQDGEQDYAEREAALQAEFAEQIEAKDGQIAELSQGLDEAKQMAEQAQQAADEMTTRLAEEERARRLAEFTETATELGVPVEAAGFAEVLMAFNDADGSEDKTAYNQLVTVMKAMASARDTSGLFNEAGSDHSGATDPVEKLNALIEERMSKYDESRGDATMAVIKHHPELYAEYDTATVRSVGHAQRGED